MLYLPPSASLAKAEAQAKLHFQHNATNPMTSNADPTSPPPHAIAADSSRRKWKRRIAALAILALAAGAIWFTTSGKSAATDQRAANQSSAVPVAAAAVRRGNFDLHLFALGTVTPLNTAIVRARVDGPLTRIAFKEGQWVKAGDLLAEIDPYPFRAQVSLAAGQLAREQALLENAQADLERYRNLLELDSISAQMVDKQASQVRQYQATVQAAQGRLDDANLQLANTRILAPISGRVGLRQADTGNLVRASDANGIVVITQLQPVGVVFSIAEDDLPRVIKRLRSGRRIPVEAYDRAQKEKLASGRLLAMDNRIDSATGTLKLKAEFPNTDGALFANQFVNVKMLVETRSKAILVPTAALQRGAAGTFVYVVKEDGSVGVTPVKTGPTQGDITVIEEGLSAGAMVVTDGADRLREGVKVEIVAREPRASGGA